MRTTLSDFILVFIASLSVFGCVSKLIEGNGTRSISFVERAAKAIDKAIDCLEQLRLYNAKVDRAIGDLQHLSDLIHAWFIRSFSANDCSDDITAPDMSIAEISALLSPTKLAMVETGAATVLPTTSQVTETHSSFFQTLGVEGVMMDNGNLYL